MAELQLEGAAAESQAAELMAEANAEDRHAAEQLANIRDGVGDRLGIAGAIREKNAVGLQREHVFRGSLRRDDGHVAIVIDEQAQNILLDAEIVGDHAIALRGSPFGDGAIARCADGRASAGSRARQRDGAARSIEPRVHSYDFAEVTRLASSWPAIVGSARASAISFFGGSAVGRDDAAQRAHIAEVPHQRARIQIPNHRDAVALQILLRGFAGAPVRSERGKFAHDQRFDVRLRRFLVVEIRAHVADVRIREADDLAGVARIGENFLIAGEAGVKNDFAAAAGASARRAAVKDSSVLERESRATCGVPASVCPPEDVHFDAALTVSKTMRQRTEMIHRPVSEDRLAVNISRAARAEHARIVGAVAMIAHHEIFVRRNLRAAVARAVQIMRRNVRLRQLPCR